MHVIVDIRTTSPQETAPVRAGIAWARLWKKYKSEDTITLLLHEHQEIVEDFSCISVPQSLWSFLRKPLRQKNIKQVFRTVKFSSLPIYDKSIPTITHVWSNAAHLYGDPTQSTLVRRYHDWIHKRELSNATTLIVPDIQIGHELVEIYDIREERIDVIPYLPLSVLSSNSPLQIIDIQSPFFLYDGTYGNEANLLTLLAAWERYRREGGKYQLLMVGAAGEYLSALTHALRSLDLMGSVRYLGFLDDGSLHSLYKRAQGWIYTGPYYSGGSNIELACAYQLPLLLSDITAFRSYGGIKVHPNHTIDIAQSFFGLETFSHTPRGAHHEQAYIDAYEKVLVRMK